MKDNTQSAGFSLVELMISLTILGIVLAGVTKVFIDTGRLHTSQEMMMEVQQTIRAAKHLMVDEIRSAACNPLGKTRIGFLHDSSAETSDINDTDAESIHFTRDIDDSNTTNQSYNPDGIVNNITNPDEELGYYRLFQPNGAMNCTTATGTVMNWNDNRPGTLCRSESGSPQPLADNITALHFQYFDRTQTELLPGSLTNNTMLDRIKTVQVTITGQVQSTARVSAANQTWTQQFTVLVRNQ